MKTWGKDQSGPKNGRKHTKNIKHTTERKGREGKVGREMGKKRKGAPLIGGQNEPGLVSLAFCMTSRSYPSCTCERNVVGESWVDPIMRIILA